MQRSTLWMMSKVEGAERALREKLSSIHFDKQKRHLGDRCKSLEEVGNAT